ncbi:MAG: DUF6265 family protein [Sphingosinicella sp.]
MISWLIALVTVQAAANPPQWLAGYWLSCEAGREVSETWSDPRGGIMLGSSLTVSATGRLSWEQTRIGPASSGTGLAFFALPSGQAAAEFPLLRASPGEVVFENRAHDFPQRVIYRRAGEALLGRIEGTIGGRERSAEWHYRAAPLNARCERAAS